RSPPSGRAGTRSRNGRTWQLRAPPDTCSGSAWPLRSGSRSASPAPSGRLLQLGRLAPQLSHEIRQQASHVAGRALRDVAPPSLHQVDDLTHGQVEVVIHEHVVVHIPEFAPRGLDLARRDVDSLRQLRLRLAAPLAQPLDQHAGRRRDHEQHDGGRTRVCLPDLSGSPPLDVEHHMLAAVQHPLDLAAQRAARWIRTRTLSAVTYARSAVRATATESRYSSTAAPAASPATAFFKRAGAAVSRSGARCSIAPAPASGAASRRPSSVASAAPSRARMPSSSRTARSAIGATSLHCAAGIPS